MVTKAEPRWDLDLDFGKQGEDYVHETLRHIVKNPLKVEVKSDRRCLDTGNIYIEYQCRKASGWEPSGIATTEADFWAINFGDTGLTLMCPTEALKQMARSVGKDKSRLREETDGSHPTKGVLIRMDDIVTLARSAPFMKGQF